MINIGHEEGQEKHEAPLHAPQEDGLRRGRSINLLMISEKFKCIHVKLTERVF